MLILKEGHHISSTITSLHLHDFIASKTLLSPESFNNEMHYHDNAHFSFVFKGGCSEMKKNRYERLPGSITWYQAGELHQITRVKTPSHHVNFELPACFFEKYDIKETTVDRAIRRHGGASLIMLKVYQELQQLDECSENSLRALLLSLLQEEAKLESAGTPAWVALARELLHDRWNEKVTLRELSEACKVHPVTVSRYFPVYFSRTLGEYCRMLKINHALSLIKSSRLSLTEISYECGFADQSHFIRTFKQLTGFLPTLCQKL